MGLSFLLCYGAGFLGSLFVQTGSGSWYDMLIKPSLTPTKYAFPVVWLILYFLMSVALWIVWEEDEYASEFRGWVPLFIAHLLLNAAWPVFFFGFHAIFIALVDIIILDFLVVLLLAGAGEVDRR
ncbi:MAG: tryptophan-rich sensory protein, partial [Candidatus Kaiserbacteria bacterium]|nr:tryptophan-rich sensory protein [Candidatus Kaiserbacteria bacterium]